MRNYHRVKKAAAKYECQRIDAMDPRIEKAVDGYRKKWGLPETAQPVASTWFGVFEEDDLLLVVGERRGETQVEVTDMYLPPGSGRRGLIAVYTMLNMYATALRLGAIKSIICTVLYRNHEFARAVESVFGVGPTAYVYAAEAA